MKKEMITIPVKAVTTLADANRVIERNRNALYTHVHTKLFEYGMPQPFCDLGFGIPTLHDRNPYDEIINIANIANIVQCAFTEAWYIFFEVERLRRELAELKGRRIEAVEYEEPTTGTT